jgi:hypothetical protein
MKLTNQEINDELEREIHQEQKKAVRRIRRAVNPQRGFGC